MRSPTYPNLRAWIMGRIRRHPSSQHSMPAHMLDNPPEYLFKDTFDVWDELRALRAEGLLASHTRRWYLTKKGTKWRQ